MAVLVTGGTGALGSMVCRLLLTQGERVVAYDARPDRSLLAGVAGALVVVQGDVLDANQLESVFREHRVDRVVHLAVVLPTQESSQPRRAFEINAMGTLNVVEACLHANVQRLVFTSSKGAFGVIRPPHAPPEFAPINEDYPRQPVLIYDISKAACEDLLAYYGRNFGLDYLTLRFPTLYGPGRLDRHGDLAIVSKILEGARAAQPVRVEAAGWSDELLYTGDVARGIELALQVRQPAHRTYLIGTGQVSSIEDVVAAVKALYPAADIEIAAGQVRENRACRFDISRAQSDLGWQPAYPLPEGLRAYAGLLEEFAPA